ncbi:MAG: hypothetical protein ACOYXA_05015 [Bacteroidota bacterium]
MNSKKCFRFSWILFAITVTYFGCTELDVANKTELPSQEFDLSSRAVLSKKLRDSTINAESRILHGLSLSESSQSDVTQASSSNVNYALQATVTAESTYPGYSVQKIKDGSRNTTVGPSYSWANNFPANGKLPESVFLKFSSLKTIDRIDIYTSSGYELQNYTIQYRTATTASWVTLLTVTGNRSVFRTHSFSTISVLEIQIICQLGPPNQTIYGRLNEVEIYGPAEPPLPYFTVENGRFVFNSAVDFEQAVEYLEFKYEQYSDAFASQYPGLTDEQLSQVEESTGFNDNIPYLNFENAYGIYSLRARLAYEEEQWLANTDGETGFDPSEGYTDDDDEMALMNYWGEVKIGSYIYMFNQDGSYYQYYDDGGCSLCVAATTSQLRNRKDQDKLPIGVTVVKPEPSAIIIGPGSCENVIKSTDFVYNSARTWRMKWKIKAVNGPFGGSAHLKAITRSYKKVNGKWKKRKAQIAAYAAGTIWDGSCTYSASIETPYKSKRARKVKTKNYYHGKVKERQILGTHHHSSVGTVQKWLE